MSKPTFISLFSGIGGLDRGLEAAGFECVAQVEHNEFCRKVLAKHWPHVPRFIDVKDFNRASIDQTPTLIAGGFPCQDLSKAGNVQGPRRGLDGERSGLWSEYLRIICEFRPRRVLVENVTKLLDRGLGRVLGDLAASGYDAEWDCIPAAALGACHIRDRVFILAYPNGEQLWDRGRTAFAGATGRMQEAAQKRDGLRTDLRSIREGAAARTRLADEWCSEPDAVRAGDGPAGWVDRRRGCGNAVHADVAQWIGERILKARSL